MMQVSPAQQSASMVHPPQRGTHEVVAQTNAGVVPFGLGMHGRPEQQSALVEQPCPAATHEAPVHRGTPTLSGLQVSCVSQLPLQQSHDALQLMVLSLQTSPLGLQPTGLRQTPSAAPAGLLHVTLPDPGPGNAAEPQQSASLEQVSPTTWHPLAGWQMRTPVGPYGAQRRLQQDPPQAGIPLAAV
jgi:hypothetical protein